MGHKAHEFLQFVRQSFIHAQFHTLYMTVVVKLGSCIHLFGVLCRFQHCTGHIMTGSWKGRGNQYIQFVRVPYCKLPTNSKQLPAFRLKAMPGTEPRPQKWEARVLPLCHRGVQLGSCNVGRVNCRHTK